MNWYSKKFSALTNVSVATLHHYDDIGLLKPSVRLSNNYRVYSESDLIKLERIIALKFFGFSLKKIKMLVSKDEDVLLYLKDQVRLLDENIKQLRKAHHIVRTIVVGIDEHNAIDWPLIVSLIKVYQMQKDINNEWARKVYTEIELKQLAEIDKKYSEEQKNAFRKLWAKLFSQVGENLNQDPAGSIGKELAIQYVALKEQLKEAYKDYPQLWEKIWKLYEEQGIPSDIFLGTKEQYNWLKKAVKALK